MLNNLFAFIAFFAATRKTSNDLHILVYKLVDYPAITLFILQRHLAEHDHGLGPVGCSQLAEYGRDVRLDGGLGHAEFITDLLV